MQSEPAIGSRVRYFSAPLFEGGKPRECTGTVRKIYRNWNYDAASGDPRWDDPDFIPRRTSLRPVAEWQATVEIDPPKPEWWPYPDTNLFAPEIGDLTLI